MTVKCKIAMDEGDECIKCCMFCDEQANCTMVCGQMDRDCLEMDRDDLEVMQNAVPSVIKSITEIAIKKKLLDEQEKKMKKKLLEAMEAHGVKSFDNGKVKFTYVAPTKRTTIDSAKLKNEYPDIAEECMKTSPIKASVKITVKK